MMFTGTIIWMVCLGFGAIVYAGFLWMMGLGLKRLRRRQRMIIGREGLASESSYPPLPPPAIAGGALRVSVVIAARNEAQCMGRTLDSLLAQAYPADRMEIMVVDDRSDDETAAIVESYSRRDPRIKLLRQKSVDSGASPKKQALEAGIAASTGEIIVTTDADCIPPREWLKTMVANFAPETGMVAGQARFELPPHAPLWQRLQALDFQSQNVAAAGLIAAGSPFNCSGASLSFRRAAYDAVGGWRGVRHLASGDDELLMAKMHRAKWKIVAAIGAAAVVKTRPPATVRELWEQRIRWGSKVRVYNPVQKFLLSGTFIFLLALSASPVVLLFSVPLAELVVKLWLSFSALKLLHDCAIMSRGEKLFQERIPILEFLLAEIIHPAAIVILALGGMFGRYEWKGRRYSLGKAS